MKKYNVQWIFTRISSKIFLLLWLFFLFLGLVYAGFFSSLPANPLWQVPGGTFSARLTNMLVSCPPGQFLKGFKADYIPVCVLYNDPTSSIVIVPTSPSSFPSTSPSGEMSGGKFGTYFNNLLSVCAWNGIIRWFTQQGQKICADASNRGTLTSNPSLVPLGAASISYPTKPSGEPIIGGEYQSFFNNMFTSTCTGDQAIQGFNVSGTPTCGFIPVDGTCSSSNGQSYYIAPTTGLCNAWNSTLVSGTGPWTWSCTGLDGGTTANCSANKKVNGSCNNSTQFSCAAGTSSSNVAGSCGWSATWSCLGANGGTDTTSCSKANAACPVNCVGSWSDINTCSLTCWGGVKQQIYTVATPAANGGISCPSANGATQWGGTSCNTQACAVQCLSVPSASKTISCADALTSFFWFGGMIYNVPAGHSSWTITYTTETATCASNIWSVLSTNGAIACSLPVTCSVPLALQAPTVTITDSTPEYLAWHFGDGTPYYIKGQTCTLTNFWITNWSPSYIQPSTINVGDRISFYYSYDLSWTLGGGVLWNIEYTCSSSGQIILTTPGFCRKTTGISSPSWFSTKNIWP